MRNTFKHLALIILLISFVEQSHGQVIADYNDISIFFGDKQKSGSSIEDFMKTKSGELLCIQNQLTVFNIFSRNNSKYSFDFITDYIVPETNPISFYGNGKKSSLTHYTILGDNVLGVSSQTSFFKKDPILYYHLINPYSQGKSNHGFSLKENFYFDKEIDLSRITLVSSKNKKYASMIYVPKTLPEEYTNINYLNFSDDLSIPLGGNFIYPFPTKDYELLDFYIEDEKTQYIVSGHFMENQTKNNWITDDKYFKSITIGRISNQEFKFEEIKSEGKFYTEIGLYSDGDQIILSGLYAPFIDGDIKGVFTAKINKAGEISNKKHTPFSKEVTSTIAAFEFNLLNDNNTIKNEYKGFNIVEFHPTKNGYVGVAEFNALEYKYGSSDVPGATNTVDSYYWSNDIIVFKLDLNGVLEWDRVVPKYQRSINDGGFYLSNTVYLTSKHLHLFFNDNLLNYNEDGIYNRNGDSPSTAQFNSGRNTIGHVSLRLNDGFVKRNSTIGKNETDVLFIPLLSRPFYNTQKLMIYGRTGNRHRIGSISFRE